MFIDFISLAAASLRGSLAMLFAFYAATKIRGGQLSKSLKFRQFLCTHIIQVETCVEKWYKFQIYVLKVVGDVVQTYICRLVLALCT